MARETSLRKAKKNGGAWSREWAINREKKINHDLSGKSLSVSFCFPLCANDQFLKQIDLLLRSRFVVHVKTQKSESKFPLSSFSLLYSNGMKFHNRVKSRPKKHKLIEFAGDGTGRNEISISTLINTLKFCGRKRFYVFFSAIVTNQILRPNLEWFICINSCSGSAAKSEKLIRWKMQVAALFVLQHKNIHSYFFNPLTFRFIVLRGSLADD